MRPVLLGTKIGMTSILDERGHVHPVSIVKAGPCVVLQVKSKETDGYDSVQLGYDDARPHRSDKATIGHCAKAGAGPKRTTREVRLTEPATVSRGDVVTVGLFSEGGVTYVDVSGTSKGKGFQGVMKRHGFGGMCASHGTERKHRSAGGIGAHAPRGTGQSVKKGKKMAGHMGSAHRTATSLRLMKVDAENNLLLIRGSIPGATGSTVYVRKAKKRG